MNHLTTVQGERVHPASVSFWASGTWMSYIYLKLVRQKCNIAGCVLNNQAYLFSCITWVEHQQQGSVSLGNRERVALREENANTTYCAQVTDSLKRPIADSSIHMRGDPNKPTNTLPYTCSYWTHPCGIKSTECPMVHSIGTYWPENIKPVTPGLCYF